LTGRLNLSCRNRGKNYGCYGYVSGIEAHQVFALDAVQDTKVYGDSQNGETNEMWAKEGELLLHIIMCNNTHMPTNLALDDRLIEEARRAGGHKTKKEAVTAALDEYVKLRKQRRILEAFGTFDFDPSYDYKADRHRKRS
jgi:Arc/MetJ family transcription regulator